MIDLMPELSRQGCLHAAVLLLAAVFAPAQTRAETLMEVFQASVARSDALRAAEALRDSAQPRAAQVRAALGPGMEVSASTGSGWVRDPNGAGSAAGRLDNASATLTMRQSLYRPSALAAAARADTEAEAAKLTYTRSYQDFVLKVTQAYLDSLSAREVQVAAGAARRRLEALLVAETRLFSAGAGTKTDVDDTRARLDAAAAQDLRAQNDVTAAQLALARLSGRNNVRLDDVAASLALPGAQPAALAAWLDKAESHPQVQRARLAVVAAERALDAARAARLPKIDAVGSISLTRLSGAGAALPGTSRNQSVGLELSLLLDARGELRHRADEAVLLVAQARAEGNSAREEVAGNIERSFLALESGLVQVRALEAAEVSSRVALDGVEVARRAGVRPQQDVLNAQNQLFETRRDLGRARCAALAAHMALRHAAGELGQADVAALSAWLAGAPAR